MSPAKFLDNGSALVTELQISKQNRTIKIINPEKMVANFITKDSFARIHSNNGSIYTVWILDEMTMAPIVVEVPLGLMGQYFKPSSHSIFPHLAMGTNV